MSGAGGSGRLQGVGGLRCAEDMLSDEMAVPVAMRTNSFSLDSAQRDTAIHCLELTDSLR